MASIASAFPLETPLPWHMQRSNWLRAETSSGTWWKVGSVPRVHALSIVRQQALSARYWPLQAFPVHNQSRRVRLPFRVAALDQVDGIERAVDRVMPPEEDAGQRHHLAATVGRQPPDDQGHGQVHQNPESPPPGTVKKKRYEHHESPEYTLPNTG